MVLESDSSMVIGSLAIGLQSDHLQFSLYQDSFVRLS